MEAVTVGRAVERPLRAGVARCGTPRLSVVALFAVALGSGCGPGEDGVADADAHPTHDTLSVDAGADGSDGRTDTVTDPTGDAAVAGPCGSPGVADVSGAPPDLTGSCADVEYAVSPYLRVGDERVVADRCVPDPDDTAGVRCNAGDGTLHVSATAAGWVVGWTGADGGPADELGLRVVATIPGAAGWLSNGFQSWSQTGMLALHEPLSPRVVATAVAARGDIEVVRSGREISWWYTLAGSRDGPHVVAGVTRVERTKAWVEVSAVGDEVTLWLASGQNAGASEPWHLAFGGDEEHLLEAYGARVASQSWRSTDASPAHAELGWNSWYELWDSVGETDVRANAALVATHLARHAPEGAPPLRIVVDDGWQQAWGVWEPNEKFPSGLDGLAADLRGDGFEVGVWLAPLLVDADTELAAEHPDWFVGEAVYAHGKAGELLVLDVTHPDAREHLVATIRRIVGWGLDLLKIDFLFAGTWNGPRAENVAPMAAYHLALETIREAAGPDTVLLAVGAPPIAGFDLVDAWRSGPDIAVELIGASWYFVPAQARTTAGRWFLCAAVLCDADPPLLRDMIHDEVETSLWVAASTGGAMFLSDDLPRLPEERLDWLDPDPIAVGISGVAARPISMYPDELPARLANSGVDHVSRVSTHAVPLEWRLPDGRSVVTNYGDVEISIEGVVVRPHQTIVREP